MVYIITIALVVSAESDEQLQTPQGIEDEIRGWLHVEVQAVVVKGFHDCRHRLEFTSCRSL